MITLSSLRTVSEVLADRNSKTKLLSLSRGHRGNWGIKKALHNLLIFASSWLEAPLELRDSKHLSKQPAAIILVDEPSGHSTVRIQRLQCLQTLLNRVSESLFILVELFHTVESTVGIESVAREFTNLQPPQFLNGKSIQWTIELIVSIERPGYPMDIIYLVSINIPFPAGCSPIFEHLMQIRSPEFVNEDLLHQSESIDF